MPRPLKSDISLYVFLLNSFGFLTLLGDLNSNDMVSGVPVPVSKRLKI
jgi:hypothetical protein